MLRCLLVALLAGCAPRAGTDTGSDETVDPWLDSLAAFRDCTGVEELRYEEGGQVLYRHELAYNAQGRLAGRAFYDFYTKDGDLVETLTNTFDALGRVIRQAQDRDPFGELDGIWDLSWDDGYGLQSVHQSSESGLYDEGEWTFTLDAQLRSVHEEFDASPYDGVADETVDRVFGAPDRGEGGYDTAWRFDTEVYSLSTGETVSSVVNQFDADGVIVARTVDFALGDQRYHEDWTLTYDDAGRPEVFEANCHDPCEGRFAQRYVTFEWQCPE